MMERFEDIGLWSGSALTGEGACMHRGVDVADFDHTGRFSIIVTNFSQEGVSLFHNLGRAGFDDISSSAGLMLPTFPYVGWGTAFFDMDNDGWPDIFVANGMHTRKWNLLREVCHTASRSFSSAQQSRPYILKSLYSFRSRQAATSIAPGAAFGDVNNDGKIDVLLPQHRRATHAPYINRTASENHAALFRLVGTKSKQSSYRCTSHGNRRRSSAIQRNPSGSIMHPKCICVHFWCGINSQAMTTVEVAWPSAEESDACHDLPTDSI